MELTRKGLWEKWESERMMLRSCLFEMVLLGDAWKRNCWRKYGHVSWIYVCRTWGSPCQSFRAWLKAKHLQLTVAHSSCLLPVIQSFRLVVRFLRAKENKEECGCRFYTPLIFHCWWAMMAVLNDMHTSSYVLRTICPATAPYLIRSKIEIQLSWNSWWMDPYTF